MAGLVEPAGASGDVGHCAPTCHWFIREEILCPIFGRITHAADRIFAVRKQFPLIIVI
jgi:hypothetical protein